jgi:hypothetical protein
MKFFIDLIRLDGTIYGDLPNNQWGFVFQSVGICLSKSGDLSTNQWGFVFQSVK